MGLYYFIKKKNFQIVKKEGIMQDYFFPDLPKSFSVSVVGWFVGAILGNT